MDKADLLSLLQSIESICAACQSVLNSHAQTALMLAVAIESRMLYEKLCVMEDRWRFHLPFKEASVVNFYDWGQKVESLAQAFSDTDDDTGDAVPDYCPSKHFLLDLYERLPQHASDPGHTPYYRELDIPKFISTQERMRRQITAQWKDYKVRFSDMAVRKADAGIGGLLHPLTENSGAVRKACCEELRLLSVELFQLNGILTGVFPRDQLVRLTERVISESDYNCRKAEQAARRYIAAIKNTNPEEEWADLFDMEILLAQETIGRLRFGSSITRFIGESNNLEGHYSGFGRFLHSCRREITGKDLYDLMEQLYRIRHIREEIELLKSAPKAENTEEATPETPAETPSPKNALAVYQRYLAAKPRRPELPVFFNESLAGSPDAVTRFYDILHRCGFFIGRTLLPEEKRDRQKKHYEGWKWRHLRDALMRAGIIHNDAPKKGLAEYLGSVFPYLSADNIKRGFNRGVAYEDRSTRRVVAAIVEEFSPVMKWLEN